MSTPRSKRASDLQITEDMPFQERMWKVQRVGWWILLAVIVAGLTGLLGQGPLSRTEVGSKTGLQIEYERFVRRESPTTLLIQVAPGAQSSGEIRLAIDREYLRAVRVGSITPEPESTQITGTAIVYVFPAEPNANAEIAFELTPNRMGRHRGFVQITGTPAVRFRQFAYP